MALKRAADEPDTRKRPCRVRDGNDRDCFYTVDAVAVQCVRHMLTALATRAPPAVVVEPSAGGGAFCRAIDALMPASTARHYIDIEPHGAGIETGDFLAWQPPAAAAPWVVGNPPFGFHSALAIAFFNHAARWADAIGFIVPMLFRNPRLLAKLDANFVRVASMPIAARSFTTSDGAFATYVATEWQVWRRIRPDESPRSAVVCTAIDQRYIVKTDIDSCEFAVQRVGNRAGRVFRDRAYINAHRTQNYIFVRFVDDAARRWCEQSNFDWTGADTLRHTVAIPSISVAHMAAWFARRYESRVEVEQPAAETRAY